MAIRYCLFLFFLVSFTSFSQQEKDSVFLDTTYLEDQIYLGISYNILTKQPADFEQNGLSGGISLGFIKDFPINDDRNLGFGVGLGYSYNAYIQNLKISNTSFEIVNNIDFNSNRFITHAVEVPIEYRWRTSTATKYNFWRIYGGVKLGYVFASSSKFTDSTQVVKTTNIKALQKFQYGLTFNAGYNTFNLSVYYGLNPLFKNVVVENQKVDLKQLNVGLMFYIL